MPLQTFFLCFCSQKVCLVFFRFAFLWCSFEFSAVLVIKSLKLEFALVWQKRDAKFAFNFTRLELSTFFFGKLLIEFLVEKKNFENFNSNASFYLRTLAWKSISFSTKITFRKYFQENSKKKVYKQNKFYWNKIIFISSYIFRYRTIFVDKLQKSSRFSN